jgi:hypothetical protein
MASHQRPALLSLTIILIAIAAGLAHGAAAAGDEAELALMSADSPIVTRVLHRLHRDADK